MARSRFTATTLRSIVGFIGRHDHYAACQAIEVFGRNGGISGTDFDGAVQFDQLRAHEVLELVDEAGEELAEWAAFDDAIQGAENPDSQSAGILAEIRYSVKLSSSANS